MNPRPLAVVALLVLSAYAGSTLAHSEREVDFPVHGGEVPTFDPATALNAHHHVVCKGAVAASDLHPAFQAQAADLNAACSFSHIQAAVDHVIAGGESGATILVMPGTYHEEPSHLTKAGCEAFEGHTGLMTYAEHLACPNEQNLIAVLGDTDDDGLCNVCDIRIAGTGASPRDVLVDAAWGKLNAIRADRADGFVLFNLMATRTDFNGIYVLQTDGFLLDKVVGDLNYEYGILVFAVDHGLIRDCETAWNGDSGIYPGSAADEPQDGFAVEITGCDSHHNALGYSGTAGNSVWAHHNRFHHNMVGVSMDSFFPGHPGLPQDGSLFEHNLIYSNNENYYDHYVAEYGTPNYYGYQGKEDICKEKLLERDVDEGFTCPVVPVPVGTGILVAGGNENTFRENWVWDNWRYGMMLFSVPAPFREEFDPEKALDTSHHNRFLDNVFGVDHDTNEVKHNGLEFWWDEGGAGNCWQGNTAPGLLGVVSDPPVLPPCEVEVGQEAYEAVRDAYRPPSPKLATLVPCALYDAPELTHPPGCTWMETPPEPTRV